MRSDFSSNKDIALSGEDGGTSAMVSERKRTKRGNREEGALITRKTIFYTIYFKAKKASEYKFRSSTTRE